MAALKIRVDQMQVLGRSVLDPFKEDLLRHLAGFAPQLYALRGEAIFREVIDDGLPRSARYGFTNRGPVRFFVECMVAYGTGFDTDFLMPDVHERLSAQRSDGQLARSVDVFGAVDRYQVATRGRNNELAIAALRRLVPFMDGLDGLADQTLEPQLLELVERIHPEKAHHVGEARLLRLVAVAREQAASHGIATGPGVGLLAGLMFALGTGVVTDPLYPWVGDTLTRPSEQDAAKRIERLRRKTRIYLAATLNNLPT